MTGKMTNQRSSTHTGDITPTQHNPQHSTLSVLHKTVYLARQSTTQGATMVWCCSQSPFIIHKILRLRYFEILTHALDSRFHKVCRSQSLPEPALVSFGVVSCRVCLCCQGDFIGRDSPRSRCERQMDKRTESRKVNQYIFRQFERRSRSKWIPNSHFRMTTEDLDTLLNDRDQRRSKEDL